MAILEIPIQKDLLAFKEQITLESTLYVFDFYFNQRQNLWFMDILDENDNPQLSGVPIQTNVPQTIHLKHQNIPPGILLPFDIQGEKKDADADDFGIRIKLLYEEVENA
ncbi:MAG: hypothetical protein GY730_10300 [bacterium]|nr:hypothetical protein [bacterium]